MPDKITVSNCLIEVLDGVSRGEDIPAWMPNCEASAFRFPSTNAEVMKSSLPEKIKVGIMVLRKTYLQAGRGRKMSALVRGIPTEAIPVVKIVLKELERQGYIFTRGSDSIVHAVRAKAVEVRQMLSTNPDSNKGIWKDLMAAK